MHGYLSLLVCIAGTVMNTLNIVVLTRKEMRSSTNLILTGIAIADLLVMVEYMPFSYLLYIKHTKGNDRFTYSLSTFILAHSIISQVFHTISIALTLILAIWRYIAIAYLQKVRSWHQISTTTKVIVCMYIICPLICSPLYFTYEVREFLTPKNETIYIVDHSQWAQNNPSLKALIQFWIYGAIIKLLPCVILTMLSLRIVYALVKKKERRKHLMDSNQLLNSSRASVKKKQSDRTTKMLLTVLLLFLITEFPQAIMGFLMALEGDVFFKECYDPLAELMDMLALVNAGINFILYCCMSRQFRVTFSALFKPRCLSHDRPSDKDTTQVTQITQV